MGEDAYGLVLGRANHLLSPLCRFHICCYEATRARYGRLKRLYYEITVSNKRLYQFSTNNDGRIADSFTKQGVGDASIQL